MNISERQLEIIEASGKILTTSGMSGLTIKNLALEIGFTESALYRHFKSKEDVIVMLIQYLHSNMKDRLDPIVASNLSAEDKIRALFESQFTFLSRNPHFVITVLSDGLIDESYKIKNEIEKVFQYKFGIITNIVSELMSENSFTKKISLKSLTHFLIGGFRLLMLRWKFSKFEFNLIQEGNELMENFIDLVKLK
jgi:TetR/AcrR family transcriptional regulator, fatty acid metabolism regulator protein